MKIRFTTTSELLGTQPADNEIFQTYIAAKCPSGEAEEIGAEDLENKATVFRRDPATGQLAVCDYHIKGMLKARGDSIRARAGKAKGADGKVVKNGWESIRGKLDDDLHVFPRLIPLGKTEPDGMLERPLRAQTMQGPRVSLARSELLNPGLTFDCEIVLLEGRVTREMVLQMLDECKLIGLGQWRNAGYGRLEYQILE